jgi:hypothetical protein
LLFHLHPKIIVRQTGPDQFHLACGGDILSLRVYGSLTSHVRHGSLNPLLGWYSANFNQLEKTTCLSFTKTITCNSSLESEISVL